MAITPLEVSTLTAAQLALVARARAIIDAEIRLQHNGTFPVKIRRGLMDFIFLQNEVLIETLTAEYEAAGWSVTKYTSDDQGDWYSLFPTT
jgi:hypothetical protein